jgi:hypothetical protein
VKRTAEQLQQILEKEMPGFKVVDDVEADAVAPPVEADETTPDLLANQRGLVAVGGGGADALAAPHAEAPHETEDQFVRVVPKHLADSPDAERHTKVVLMSSEGKIVASQG